MDSRMLGPGSSVRFIFTGEQGAALVTKYQTYREHVQDVGKFKTYAEENHTSWVEFARNAGRGDVKPVLVTGVDRTKDFAMMCYSNYDDGLECEFRTSSSAPWGAWKTPRPIYQHHGPQLCHPSSTPALDSMSSDNSDAETDSDEYNQCIFVRFTGMRARRSWIPRIMKAAAGPHDPGTRGHDGEGSPPQAQSDPDSGSDTSLDGDWGNEMGSDTSVDSGADAFIDNPTMARYQQPSPFRPCRSDPHRTKGMTLM